MKKIHKDPAARTRAYRERQQIKKEAAAEQASQEAVARAWDLRCFGESAYDHNAETAAEEIHIHRQFLRALGEGDVQSGETLRQLSKRVWVALLAAKDIGISSGGGKWVEGQWVPGFSVWIPYFNPRTQQFDGGPKNLDYGCLGYGWREGMKSDFFEKYWVPPADTSGDEVIKDLPSLPPIKLKKPESKQAKPVRPPAPPIEQPQDFVTGLETPTEEQNRLIGFGNFGMTRASHT